MSARTPGLGRAGIRAGDFDALPAADVRQAATPDRRELLRGLGHPSPDALEAARMSTEGGKGFCITMPLLPRNLAHSGC
ncbi:hypothetical protein CA984_30400 [Streptosporangium minutum]|uniref:Uncharacterized protein n=1 Tax=Streptosporangium minutum TaxID=569862 RepID=A0A243RCH8_9ACTN|nr:hypothetical protein CA984_30400 [Streptosporangium minutum]